jgi:hypothetical protein
LGDGEIKPNEVAGHYRREPRLLPLMLSRREFPPMSGDGEIKPNEVAGHYQQEPRLLPLMLSRQEFPPMSTGREFPPMSCLPERFRRFRLAESCLQTLLTDI